jgi:hypothetical protein
VVAALEDEPRVLAIIDGYFERMPSVWHKEILFALSRRVHVLGGASMGALRAAELDRFGMVGVGVAYQAFSSGALTDDDEVAVVHGPADTGYWPLSEALIDLRGRIAWAVQAGAIPRRLRRACWRWRDEGSTPSAACASSSPTRGRTECPPRCWRRSSTPGRRRPAQRCKTPRRS